MEGGAAMTLGARIPTMSATTPKKDFMMRKTVKPPSSETVDDRSWGEEVGRTECKLGGLVLPRCAGEDENQNLISRTTQFLL